MKDYEQLTKCLELLKAEKQVNEDIVNSGFIPRCIYDDLNELKSIEIEALEKQIPKPVGKRELRKHELGTPYYCPECEADITHVEFFRPDGSEPEEKVSYCWACGQALDWSE